MRNYGDYIEKETILEHIEPFLASLRAERTRTEYVGYLRLLCDYLCMDFMDIGPAEADRVFHNWKQRIPRGELSKKTVCVRLSCYNSLARYIELGSNGEYKNPFEHIERPEVIDKISPLNIPTLDEMDKILSAASGDPMAYLIFALVSRCAISATKITRITFDSIIKEGDKVGLIFAETAAFKEDNIVMLPDDVATLFMDYVNTPRYRDSVGHIFYNKHNHPISIKNLDSLASKYIGMTGYKYTLKDLRSFAIIEMANAGVEESDVMKYVNIGAMRTRQFYEAKGVLSKCPANAVNYRLVV